MGRYVYSGTSGGGLTSSKSFLFKPIPGGGNLSATWTVPSDVTCATFEVWGGGGSGSPGCCCTCYYGNPGSG